MIQAEVRGNGARSVQGTGYVICKSCVMDTSDPRISFDAEGVCDHCRDFEKNILPQWDTGVNGERKLERIVSEIKKEGKGKDFDCLLGISGGIDSSYMLHVMVTRFGLRPLVFHVDGGWNSELAVHNINALIDGLGVDLYTEVINWEEMRDFQLAWFKAGVPHIDIPQDHAFVATLYKFAETHRIRYILNGGNFSTECVRNPKQFFYYGTDMRHIREVIRRFGSVPMREYPFSSVFRHKIYLRYLKRVAVVKPLNLMRYVKKEAQDELQRSYGWRPYHQKHFESRFTQFYEGFWLPRRFGFDTRRVQLSSLILTGQLSRAEALRELEGPALEPDVLRREIEFVSAKLGISQAELSHYLEMPRKFYWDYANQEILIDLGARILSTLRLDRVLSR
jgi:N-acetyl sugar amidotransferase